MMAVMRRKRATQLELVPANTQCWGGARAGAGRKRGRNPCVPHVRTPKAVRNAISYVLLNSRRHLAKLGRRLSRIRIIDPASSGRWFDGWCIELPRAPDLPAVARPRTWLLGAGWRRAGRIDPAEVPGARRC
jgi:hypothetical protein